MNHKQRQEKKKKNRAKKAKAKVRKRREWIRKKAREIKEDEKWQKHFEVKGTTIRNEPQITPQTQVDDPARVAYVRKRLEHNMKILKALEEEMENEEMARSELSDNLEAAGAVTLKDKMERIGRIAEQEVADGKYETKGTDETPTEA